MRKLLLLNRLAKSGLAKNPAHNTLPQIFARALPGPINIRLAVLRKLATEASENGLLDPALAAGITKVKGVTRKGVRTGNWLTREQARDLLLAPDT